MTCYDCKFARNFWQGTTGTCCWCGLKYCTVAAEVPCRDNKAKIVPLPKKPELVLDKL